MEGLEKARTALEKIAAPVNDSSIFTFLGYASTFREYQKIAREALAELEKSAVHGPIYVPDAWEKEVDRISESYHAKKCAECWRVPRVMCSICGDPIIVGGVCENCVPDMFNGDRHFHSSDVGEFRKNLNSDIDEIIKNEPEAPHA